MMMMNVLAFSLVVSSLAAAGVWSPTPTPHNEREKVIFQEGHRVIVVEYEKKGAGNTKVSISPPEPHPLDQSPPPNVLHDIKTHISDAGEKLSEATTGAVEHTKEKLKEAASVLPNLGQGLSYSPPTHNGPVSNTQGAKELICDAFGKCKHKISSALSGAKEKALEVEDAARDAVGEAKEEVSEKVVEAREAVENAKEKGRNVSEKAKEAKERVEIEVERVKASVPDLSWERAWKNLANVVWRGRDVMAEAVAYVWSWPVGVKLKVRELMGMVELLGFSSAYGTCVWITFASSYVLAGVLPRQQFAVVQSRVYPVYFKAMAYCVGLALIGHLFSKRGMGWFFFMTKAEIFHCCNLLVSFLMILTNLLYLEPRATKVMFERMKIEKEEGMGKDGLTSEPSRAAECHPISGATATAATTATTSRTTPRSAPTPLVLEKQEQELVKLSITRLNERLKALNTYSSFLNVLSLMALTWHLVYLGQRLHMTCPH
ncbi:uncharacterized protein LOC131161522 [Malania oleifera]|uniref:uncharacterized protein LOC131161522 n=1 Tax=Malania oleifera TaxID=397392 RepID=UPI0025AE813C|nr:uncharacterized protein LOC131161522 [Malania oleifera]